ncbi:NAD(+) diphosphatase [Nocardia flavorosea]|uniref:NAD(+) diphosphatase n=1 Tax=Nocardia flavorosea TaxID=53429 RepID=A0A846Y8W9_9NOCA|nr:NAD(+) diphosphatase [Nocardia flavorosea]NKY55297.1 NAD(+) diphosphatase [Nocardia flavorosea]
MAVFELNQIPLLSRSALDRADHLRGDAHALKEGWATARLLRIGRRGAVRYESGALVWEAATELSDEPSPEAVFIGVRDGVHLWAVRDRELAGELRDLRQLADSRIDDFTAGVLSAALALINWHAGAAFHGADGSPMIPAKAGWSRVTEDGREDFPRTDPAVICLIHDGGDRVLLARQHNWPATMFSLLAGFVEAGESLERCVEREMLEEVGLAVRDIRYLGSQPWPFPRSLMLGFCALADPEQPLVFTDGEIAEARWFTRDEVRAALAAGGWPARPGAGIDPDPEVGPKLLLPGAVSIARTIVESWVAADGAGASAK